MTIASQPRRIRPILLAALALLALSAAQAGPASARLTRIEAAAPVVLDFPVFGATGAYVVITGTYEGVLDPADRRNALITDIALAPRDNGLVRYVSTFAIL